MGTEIFHADGQTDGNVERHNEANGIFSQLYKRAYTGNEKKSPIAV
jgi:hypothetical protein